MSAHSQSVRQQVRAFRASGQPSFTAWLQQEVGWNADQAAEALQAAGFDDQGQVLPETLQACEEQLMFGMPYVPGEELQTCMVADDTAMQGRFRQLAGQNGGHWSGMSDEELQAVMGSADLRPQPIEGPSIGVDHGGVPVTDPVQEFRDGLDVIQGPLGVGAGVYTVGRATGRDHDEAMQIAEIGNAAAGALAASGRAHRTVDGGRGAAGTGPVGGRPTGPFTR